MLIDYSLSHIRLDGEGLHCKYDISPKKNCQSINQFQAHILHKIDIENLGAQGRQIHWYLTCPDLDRLYVVDLSRV